MSMKNSVLIVDDDQASITALSHMLRPDYTVYAVKNGKEALETAKLMLPDVILLDIIMPEMDGYTVFNALKADKRICNIPVIFITSINEPESEEKGLAMGAVDYIIKPFSPVIVKLRVENQVKLIRQMRLLLEKEIEEKNYNARMDMLLNMSYEMLTPTNTIISMTHTAKKSGNPDEVSKCLDDIDSATKQLLQLIKKLLNE